MHFVNCKRIPQQGRSFCSSFVLSFSLIVPTIFFYMFKDLSMESRNIETQNCAPSSAQFDLVMINFA